MKAVFIGGSRRLSRLNEQIRDKLAEITSRGMQVLIGDANGADRAVQVQLAKWGYQNVTVFFVGTKPRNNAGAWTPVRVPTPGKARGFDFYAVKDIEMAHKADCGLMIWDGESRGTLSNVVNLTKEQKPVAVYVSSQRRFKNVLSMSDLESLGATAVVGGNDSSEPMQSELPLGISGKVVRTRRRRAEG